jgi:hypothetical protein
VDLCATSNDACPERIVNVNHEIMHNFDAVNFKFTTTLDEDVANESWGIRQFFLYVAACSNHCEECLGPNGKDCLACESPFVLQDGDCKDPGTWESFYEDFTSNDFTDAKDWVIESTFKGTTDVITDCGGTKLVGGYGVFGDKAKVSREFTDLPTHKRVRVRVEVWKIDAWDGEELFLNIDGERVWS